MTDRYPTFTVKELLAMSPWELLAEDIADILKAAQDMPPSRRRTEFITRVQAAERAIYDGLTYDRLAKKVTDVDQA